MGKIVHFFGGVKMCREIISNIRENYTKLEQMPNASKELLKGTNIKELFPVPVIDIAKEIGFKIFEMIPDERELSGLVGISLEYEKDFGTDKIIAVNSDDNYGHKRFAIAHEIAHYIFDFDEKSQISYYNTYYTNERSETAEERRANYFAACLLMPEEQFKKKYDENFDENSLLETTKKLADIFKVSPEAVRRRINELKLAEVKENG
ncbi:MAG: ImmA/IrrE family metallo-endopeptidase [Candidatus Fimenecus sp.]